jgi:hypothetical protein
MVRSSHTYKNNIIYLQEDKVEVRHITITIQEQDTLQHYLILLIFSALI